MYQHTHNSLKLRKGSVDAHTPTDIATLTTIEQNAEGILCSTSVTESMEISTRCTEALNEAVPNCSIAEQYVLLLLLSLLT